MDGYMNIVFTIIILLLVSERFMAKENPLLVTDRPHQLFADAPPSLSLGGPPAPPSIAAPVPTPLMGMSAAPVALMPPMHPGQTL